VTAVVALAAVPASAAADEFVPTRFDDPAPNGCKPADCSLREAIKAANNHGGADRVSLSSGTYRMEIPGTSGASIEDGDFNILGDLTIRGRGVDGPDKTTVNGKGLDRVFTAVGDAKFLRLQIRGGDASADPAHTSFGGGLAAFGDKVVLKNVFLTRNAATYGGGIWSVATDLRVLKSTVYYNQSTEGAGLDLDSSTTQPVTTVRASSIVSNPASQKGGGILVDGFNSGGNNADPFLIVENSTFVNNVGGVGPGTKEGGAIMADNGAVATIEQSTFWLNRAGDVQSTGIGGGLYEHSSSTINPGDSIFFANFVGTGVNVRSDVPGAQCAGTINGSGGNLVQTLAGTACTFTGGYTETNDAKLGDYGDYGGPTKTVPLLTGSPAIGLAGSCPPKDQRGVPRPVQDCDSGAYENTDP